MTAPPPNRKRPDISAARYLSMATYMAVIITAGALGGRWLDAQFPMGKIPVFTLVLTLVSVFAAIWYFIKDFLKKK
ncbi:MAG: AtpZ/AtpI family protein [Bacteroidia bacterium]|jgi:membrane protein DedA with SNARE-associated domain|nr:AtpZ/AtpI family protein [Bacteroidia bacterium]